MKYGELITKNRKINNISREQMSDLLGIVINTYKKIELNQREPTLSEICKISQRLNINPIEFFPDYIPKKIDAENASSTWKEKNVITISLDRSMLRIILKD